jgi:pseudouridine-5'-phosphate glycosidase
VEEGGVPATIGVWRGRPTVGLTEDKLEEVARHDSARKAARRDLAAAIVGELTAGTTVAATIALAHLAGIRVLATGGIGGVHRGSSWDVSADLWEIARMAVVVVCAGAKSIVDIARTLQVLETYGVPVLGYGTADFPAFYLRSSGEAVDSRVDSPAEAAALLAAHWQLGQAGVILAQPVAGDVALEKEELEDALINAERQASKAGIQGKDLTPFLLKSLAELTRGKTLRANQSLVIANARLAARVAKALTACADPE